MNEPYAPSDLPKPYVPSPETLPPPEWPTFLCFYLYGDEDKRPIVGIARICSADVASAIDAVRGTLGQPGADVWANEVKDIAGCWFAEGGKGEANLLWSPDGAAETDSHG